MFLLCVYSGVKLLAHIPTAVSLLRNSWALFQGSCNFIFLSTRCEFSPFSMSGLMLAIFCLLILAVLVGKKWYLTRVLICTPLVLLMTFPWDFWPFVYLLWKDACSSPLLIDEFHQFVFSLLSCMSSFSVLCTHFLLEKVFSENFLEKWVFSPSGEWILFTYSLYPCQIFCAVLWTLFVVLSEVQFLEKISLF